MATSSQAELDRVARWIQRDPGLGSAAFTKPQLIAAVAATDAWIDANSAAFNAALPAGFRSTATAQQKAMLLLYVMMRRYGGMPIDGGD